MTRKTIDFIYRGEEGIHNFTGNNLAEKLGEVSLMTYRQRALSTETSEEITRTIDLGALLCELCERVGKLERNQNGNR